MAVMFGCYQTELKSGIQTGPNRIYELVSPPGENFLIILESCASFVVT